VFGAAQILCWYGILRQLLIVVALLFFSFVVMREQNISLEFLTIVYAQCRMFLIDFVS
jgi:hypothetical protein